MHEIVKRLLMPRNALHKMNALILAALNLKKALWTPCKFLVFYFGLLSNALSHNRGLKGSNF